MGDLSGRHCETSTVTEQSARRLCHDLRQYVAASRRCLELVRERGEDAAAEPHLDSLEEQLGEMSRLIASELQRGRTKAEPEEVELVRLVERCARTARAAWPVPITLQVADRPVVRGGWVDLQRALGNLVENAARASRRTGVRLRVDVEEPYAVVDIVDDGPGFGLVPRGTGQGLEAAWSDVMAHGGLLEIDRTPGEGTRVRVLLPLAVRSEAS